MRLPGLLLALLAVGAADAQESVSCLYEDKRSAELQPAADCGRLDDDGTLHVGETVLQRQWWSKYGLGCIVVSSRSQGGWYYINQNGLGRRAPFIQDNDCAPFTAGVAVGLEHGRVVFFDQTMRIVKRTRYVWASGFEAGFAKVCRGNLVKEWHGEHYLWKGGLCGFIDREFREVLPVTHPFESTPSPPRPGAASKE